MCSAACLLFTDFKVNLYSITKTQQISPIVIPRLGINRPAIILLSPKKIDNIVDNM